MLPAMPLRRVPPLPVALALVAAALVVGVALFLPGKVQADEFNLKTYITVDQPVQIPGATLQPNVKYVFRRLSPDSGLNHVVRVMNADETKVIATFFAISDQRLDPPDQTILTFYETAAGYARPVRSWFYPGRTIGLEFLYPKAKMADINAHLIGTQPAAVQTAAVETQSTVPQSSDENTIAQDQDTEAQVQPEPLAEVTPQLLTPPVLTPVTPEEPEATAPATDQETAMTEQNNTTPTELPRTAGELPLLAVFGLAAISLRKSLRRG